MKCSFTQHMNMKLITTFNMTGELNSGDNDLID